MKNILLLILLISSPGLFGQDLSEQYEYAKNLFAEEKYFDAVTEFKRLVFFDSSSKYTAESEYYIGLSYKKGAFYSEAIAHFTSAYLNTADTNFVFRIKTEIIKSNILRRTFSRAMQIISELEKGTRDKEKIKELIILRGFVFVFADNWEQGGNYFRSAGYDSLARLTELNLSEKYSETTAKILSVLLPGAGQFYTGEYINGLISLAWNAFSAYLTVDAFMSDRIFDGVVLSNFLWYRFYSGNIYNAGKFARMKNQSINTKYLQILQNSADYRLD